MMSFFWMGIQGVFLHEKMGQTAYGQPPKFPFTSSVGLLMTVVYMNKCGWTDLEFFGKGKATLSLKV